MIFIKIILIVLLIYVSFSVSLSVRGFVRQKFKIKCHSHPFLIVMIILALNYLSPKLYIAFSLLKFDKCNF